METLIEFIGCLMLVIAGNWWRTRGRRMADAEQKAKIEQLKELGVKFD